MTTFFTELTNLESLWATTLSGFNRCFQLYLTSKDENFSNSLVLFMVRRSERNSELQDKVAKYHLWYVIFFKINNGTPDYPKDTCVWVGEHVPIKLELVVNRLCVRTPRKEIKN